MFPILTNHTPHPVHIYPADAPDVTTAGAVSPVRVIARAPQTARLAEVVWNPMSAVGSADGEVPVPVVHVTYRPWQIVGLPDPEPGVGRIVSMPVALALPRRTDLLVPFLEVRNSTGTVIGCRALARPSAVSMPRVA